MPKRRKTTAEENGERPLLNKRHESFCVHYVGDCRNNASASYLAAGYHTKNANVMGPRMLANDGITRRIRHLQDELAETERLRMIDFVRHMKAVATVTIADFLGSDGRIDPDKLHDPWLSQAIKKITPILDKFGHIQDYILELKDSMHAFELLGLTDQKAAPDQNNQILVIKV